MRPFHVCALGLITLACPLVRFEYDPHAVAPSYDRWEAIVPASADSAYGVALAVVIESGYTVAAASRADGVLTTHVRFVDIRNGWPHAQDNVRFTIAVLPVGADSVRISVTGESCGEVLSACRVITTSDGGPKGSWQFVRRLGEATLSRLNAE